MAACAPPGGGRQDMTSRFTRHVHLLSMPPTSEVCSLAPIEGLEHSLHTVDMDVTVLCQQVDPTQSLPDNWGPH